MIVLGMDLSIACPGFAVGEILEGKVNILHVSHIKTRANRPHGERLRTIFDHLNGILHDHAVQVVVREKAIPAGGGKGYGYVAQVNTIMVLNKVVGISDLATDNHGHKSIHEIAPTTLKKLLTGSGKADKKEVQAAVKTYLPQPFTFKNTDESDAVATIIGYGLEKGLLVN